MTTQPINEPGTIRMHGTDAIVLGHILQMAESNFKTMAEAAHDASGDDSDTNELTDFFLLRAAICQSAYLQLEGMLPPATPGAIDWAVGVAQRDGIVALGQAANKAAAKGSQPDA